MAYEASEIMFAAALLCKPKPSDYENATNLRAFIAKARKEVERNPTKVQFGDTAMRQGFLSLMDPSNDKMVADMARGISAAIAVRAYMGAGEKEITSYMTGNTWPNEVKKFKVSAYGFQDYNSSDVMVTADKETFYGISLKKKNKSRDASPTLINKAFDSVLVGTEFAKIKNELATDRADFFADLVIEAVEKGIISKYDIDNFDRLKVSNKKELFEAKSRDKTKFDRSYINTKGYVASPRGYKDSNTRDRNSMRFFVNSKLADPNNRHWTKVIKVLNDNIDLFSESLLNIILKTKLFKEMEAKDLEENTFDFALVTGVGNVRKDDVDVGRGDVISLKTTLCGLSRLDELYPAPYKIELDSVKQDSANAAKIFLKMKKKNLTLLDLEIRYKGDFSSQPQWQGTLNYDFINFLKKECDL